jgi:hypothetical protein
MSPLPRFRGTLIFAAVLLAVAFGTFELSHARPSGSYARDTLAAGGASGAESDGVEASANDPRPSPVRGRDDQPSRINACGRPAGRDGCSVTTANVPQALVDAFLGTRAH